MSIPQLTNDLDIIQKLENLPNDSGATPLTADQLKAKYDEAANIIKSYLNTNTPNLATLTDLANVVLGQITDRTLTYIKIALNTITEAEMATSMKKQAGGVAKYDDVGAVSTLNTTSKIAVGAINEILSSISNDVLLKSLFVDSNDFIVGTGTGTVAKKTLTETKSILGITTATQINQGTFTDYSTSILASSIYTKTIPLGFNGARGRIIISLGGANGFIGWFSTDISKTTALNVESGAISFVSGSGGITGYSFGGSQIQLYSIQINGSNLEIKFRNKNTSPATIGIPIALWEVEG